MLRLCVLTQKAMHYASLSKAGEYKLMFCRDAEEIVCSTPYRGRKGTEGQGSWEM